MIDYLIFIDSFLFYIYPLLSLFCILRFRVLNPITLISFLLMTFCYYSSSFDYYLWPKYSGFELGIYGHLYWYGGFAISYLLFFLSLKLSFLYFSFGSSSLLKSVYFSYWFAFFITVARLIDVYIDNSVFGYYLYSFAIPTSNIFVFVVIVKSIVSEFIFFRVDKGLSVELERINNLDYEKRGKELLKVRCSGDKRGSPKLYLVR